MKKVVKSLPVDFTLAIHVSAENKYYGVISFERKGFITRSQYECGPFLAYCSHSLTDGNQWHFTANNLMNLIEILLENGFEVFEFDERVELFAWLAN